MGAGRFTSFSLAVGESDLYVGFRGSVERSVIELSTLRQLDRKSVV